MVKKFKILEREPYKFTSRAGQVYDKCRYKTDSDLLDIFAMNLEVGQTYDFEEVEKESNGRVYKNWVLAKPKSSLELRIEVLEKKFEQMNYAKVVRKEPTINGIPANKAYSDEVVPDFDPGDEAPPMDLKDIPF